MRTALATMKRTHSKCRLIRRSPGVDASHTVGLLLIVRTGGAILLYLICCLAPLQATRCEEMQEAAESVSSRSLHRGVAGVKARALESSPLGSYPAPAGCH